MNVDSILKGIQRIQRQPFPTTRAPRSGMTRMYANAIPTSLSKGLNTSNTSADQQLLTSLLGLRSKSRQLVRDAAFAKNARRLIQNNVIGTGVKLQAFVQNTRGGLNTIVNDSIEAAWEKWCSADSCHTGGEVHFHDLERMAIGQVFEAGEIFIRIHRRKFGNSEVPLALEIIEAERVIDGFSEPVSIAGAQTRMGVEVDAFKRPIAYWVRDQHPGDMRVNAAPADQVQRIPAADMFHLRVIDRWPQTRGEPWLHAVAGKLGDMNGYSEAEIIAARTAANYMGVIESGEQAESMGEETPDGSFEMDIEPGSWYRTLPGEKAELWAPNRPNAALDPFMRFMLREVASGIGVSYESLSRDYSQSNYSSSRLAILDDRDVWKTLQQWFVRSFRCRLHLEWMQAAVLSGAIPQIDLTQYALNSEKFTAAVFRPRGWSWVDPTKEVDAFEKAVQAGFTTVSAVIAQTSGGDDLEDVVRARRDELEYMRENNIVPTTSPEVYVPAETRGQMILDDDGKIQPAAAEIAPPPPKVAEPEPPKRGLHRFARVLKFRDKE
jgi:lambda family phage portal protein